MKSKTSKSLIHGILPPLISPLKDDRTLDTAALETLVDHVLHGGVHGLFLLGTTGEGPGLSHQQRKGLVESVCAHAASKVPVLVSVTNASFEQSMMAVEIAAAAGAKGVVVAPPPYYSTSQKELLDYLETFAGKSVLPTYLYNAPQATKVMIGWETVAKAAEMDGMAGYKDSSGNMVEFHKVLRAVSHLENFSVNIGSEELLSDALLLGADGGVCGGANVFPSLFVDMYRACVEGDLDLIRSLHERIIELSCSLYELDRSSVGYIKSIKTALAQLDICGDQMTMPFGKLDAGFHPGISDFLKSVENRQEIDCLQSN
jgi:4-hydroxy-tetrahydrodipicolinate synthase